MTTTVRVSDQTRARVAALAAATGHKMTQVLDDAIAEYERKVFWDGFDAGWANVQRDAAADTSVQRERESEAGALRDGLE